MASAGVSRPSDILVFGNRVSAALHVSKLQIVCRADDTGLQAQQNADLVALAALPNGASRQDPVSELRGHTMTPRPVADRHATPPEFLADFLNSTNRYYIAHHDTSCSKKWRECFEL